MNNKTTLAYFVLFILALVFAVLIGLLILMTPITVSGQTSGLEYPTGPLVEHGVVSTWGEVIALYSIMSYVSSQCLVYDPQTDYPGYRECLDYTSKSACQVYPVGSVIYDTCHFEPLSYELTQQ